MVELIFILMFSIGSKYFFMYGGFVMNCSPICLFTYNRLSETKETVEALKDNLLASESDLLVFSDGWKNELAKNDVLSVRKFISSINGFKSVKVIESGVNKGLARSIIEGVTQLINEYGSVIVMEDDLITSPNFLSYMNQSLNFYRNNSKVWSVSGFSFPINYPENYGFDNSFGVRASSWGWATWKDRWERLTGKCQNMKAL